MINPIPFDAGTQWSHRKTVLFNMLFEHIVISFDWRGENLLFLNDLKHLRSIVIETTRTLDLSPIGECLNIDTLILACRISKSSTVELSRLPLKFYKGPDAAQLSSVYQNEQLKEIYINNYQGKDLVGWNTRSIERITLENSKSLMSLQGIENFSNLKLVEVNNCPNLERPLLYQNDYPFLRIYVDGVLCR